MRKSTLRAISVRLAIGLQGYLVIREVFFLKERWRAFGWDLCYFSFPLIASGVVLLVLFFSLSDRAGE
jgi:hypothetical protein